MYDIILSLYCQGAAMSYVQFLWRIYFLFMFLVLFCFVVFSVLCLAHISGLFYLIIDSRLLLLLSDIPNSYIHNLTNRVLKDRRHILAKILTCLRWTKLHTCNYMRVLNSDWVTDPVKTTMTCPWTSLPLVNCLAMLTDFFFSKNLFDLFFFFCFQTFWRF